MGGAVLISSGSCSCFDDALSADISSTALPRRRRSPARPPATAEKGRARYAPSLQAWLQHFPAEQLHFIQARLLPGLFSQAPVFPCFSLW